MDRVLVVTGSLISPADRSLVGAVRRQVDSFRASSAAWLDLQLKALGLERQLAVRLQRASLRLRRRDYAPAVRRFFEGVDYVDVPELTEVVLVGLLEAEGIPFDVTTYAELHADPERREELLARCGCVFASATLLRDMSELAPLIAVLDRPHNRVVVGGSLASTLHADWSPCPGVDVLAVGYGELLVPALARWIRAGYRPDALTPPEGGWVRASGETTILGSGAPDGKSLDWLPTPDWSLAERVHGRRFSLVHYESVRGCPYRCAFCNYPYLFDDTLFRTKSAERIAADWLGYAAQGVQWISCLDSLFTIPPKRLRALCERLIAEGSPVRWICYARADDLADRATCELMHAAGCRLVNVGIESGDQGMLDHMNKRCTVENNRAALRNCREVGLTSLVTVIVGFPGETPATVRSTFALLRDAPPDFFYVGAFTTRVEALPILQPDARARFGIRTSGGDSSSQPYWAHASMDCTEVGRWLRWLNRSLIEEQVSLEGSMFYGGMLDFDPADRADLLAFQRDALRRPLLASAFAPLHGWIQRKLEVDVERTLGPAREPVASM